MNPSCPKSDLSLLGRMALLHVGVCLLFPTALGCWALVWCVLKTLLVIWGLFMLNCGVTFVILRRKHFNHAAGESLVERRP